MSDVQRVKTDVMTCKDCVYADADDIRCHRPDEVADCYDYDGTQYICATSETE